jgi:hypothetical protein
VADTLDRLRALTGATDVALGSSSNSAADAQSSSSSRKPYLVSGSGANDGCGTGRPRVAFDATVTLTAPGASQLVESTPTPTGAGS